MLLYVEIMRWWHTIERYGKMSCPSPSSCRNMPVTGAFSRTGCSREGVRFQTLRWYPVARHSLTEVDETGHWCHIHLNGFSSLWWVTSRSDSVVISREHWQPRETIVFLFFVTYLSLIRNKLIHSGSLQDQTNRSPVTSCPAFRGVHCIIKTRAMQTWPQTFQGLGDKTYWTTSQWRQRRLI